MIEFKSGITMKVFLPLGIILFLIFTIVGIGFGLYNFFTHSLIKAVLMFTVSSLMISWTCIWMNLVKYRNINIQIGNEFLTILLNGKRTDFNWNNIERYKDSRITKIFELYTNKNEKIIMIDHYFPSIEILKYIIINKLQNNEKSIELIIDEIKALNYRV